eukprot:CAMPEP_0116875738 /NCGR_PEP_ID=MMETSP0463-20121206/7801_1 /TAXON_ID=181622 /ORGANISM="Strombidinopsis sp, Strain SopsisLIS2011" /LENGTH=54 /DNA_ID=CAMNT_0004521885 /DNA_START=579 /DNA_END=743 /DNA_ORIENTATION=+
MKKLLKLKTDESYEIIQGLKDAIWKKIPDLLNQNPDRTIERVINILRDYFEEEK